jgi:uncharacterized BrkB/YihY/UPF0761 family membrane protein
MGRWSFGCVFVGVTLNVLEPRICHFVVFDKVLEDSLDNRCIPGAVFLSLALIAVALITFFGVLGNTSPQDPRGAITISVVTVFLILVSQVAFYSLVPKEENLAFQPISQAMITSFTAIVGIVIPFYFGATAYENVNDQRRQRDDQRRQREAVERERDELRRERDELRQRQEPPS